MPHPFVLFIPFITTRKPLQTGVPAVSHGFALFLPLSLLFILDAFLPLSSSPPSSTAAEEKPLISSIPVLCFAPGKVCRVKTSNGLRGEAEEPLGLLLVWTLDTLQVKQAFVALWVVGEHIHC